MRSAEGFISAQDTVQAQPEQRRRPVDFVMEFFGKSFTEAVAHDRIAEHKDKVDEETHERITEAVQVQIGVFDT